MNINFTNTRFSLFFRFVAVTVITVFTMSVIHPTQVANAQSQTVVNLPAVGAMVSLSKPYAPVLIKGLKVFPEEPFRFDFIVDTGEGQAEGEDLRVESSKLIKYFLASLTVPEKDLWVNLSPYESDRIIPEKFGVTEMGRDLLAQDYLLKQITASLMYPGDELGAEFWDRVHERAYEEYGVMDVPVDTFNKVWIVPSEAVVYENVETNTAFVVESRLKVMLEADYVAMGHNVGAGFVPAKKERATTRVAPTTSIIREILIPEIEREVNEGANFAQLRQIYHSLILATWFKRKLKNSVGTRHALSSIYIGQNKVDGVDIEDKQAKQKIYDQYLEAFKVGVYDYIKEDYDFVTETIVPRKYFSGGMDMGEEVEDILLVAQKMPFHVIQGIYDDGAMFVNIQAQVKNTGQKDYESAKVSVLPPEKFSDAAMITRQGDQEKLDKIKNRIQATEYALPEENFKGIDWEHFAAAQRRLADDQLDELELKSLLSNLGILKEEKDFNLSLKEFYYDAIVQQLVKDGYTEESIGWILNGHYTKPNLTDEVDSQSGDPKGQGIMEAIANSIDAWGGDIGKFGRGIKQIADWLETGIKGRIDVYTLAEGGDTAYQLTMLKDSVGQVYIQIKVITHEQFWEAAEGQELEHGTIVEIQTGRNIPEEMDEYEESKITQSELIDNARERFAYNKKQRIVTQKGGEEKRVNGWEYRTILVPEGEPLPTEEDRKGKDIKLLVSKNTIKIIDNGKGMNGVKLSRMFVPGEGDKTAKVVKESDIKAALKHVMVISDARENKAKVAFVRNEEVLRTIPLEKDMNNDDINPEALVQETLMLEFNGFVDIAPSRSNIHFPKRRYSNDGRWPMQVAVEHMVEGILNNEQLGLSDIEKLKYVNTIAAGLDNLAGDNKKSQAVVRDIKLAIRQQIAGTVAGIKSKGAYVFLPHQKMYAQIAQKAVYLDPMLFDWNGEFSLKKMGARIMDKQTFKFTRKRNGEDKDIPLVAVPFTEEAIGTLTSFSLATYDFYNPISLPIIDADSFIAIPLQFAEPFFALAEKQQTEELTQEEQVDFLFFAELIKLKADETIDTSYEIVNQKKTVKFQPSHTSVKKTNAEGANEEVKFREFLSIMPSQAETPEIKISSEKFLAEKNLEKGYIFIKNNGDTQQLINENGKGIADIKKGAEILQVDENMFLIFKVQEAGSDITRKFLLAASTYSKGKLLSRTWDNSAEGFFLIEYNQRQVLLKSKSTGAYMILPLKENYFNTSDNFILNDLKMANLSPSGRYVIILNSRNDLFVLDPLYQDIQILKIQIAADVRSFYIDPKADVVVYEDVSGKHLYRLEKKRRIDNIDYFFSDQDGEIFIYLSKSEGLVFQSPYGSVANSKQIHMTSNEKETFSLTFKGENHGYFGVVLKGEKHDNSNGWLESFDNLHELNEIIKKYNLPKYWTTYGKDSVGISRITENGMEAVDPDQFQSYENLPNQSDTQLIRLEDQLLVYDKNLEIISASNFDVPLTHKTGMRLESSRDNKVVYAVLPGGEIVDYFYKTGDAIMAGREGVIFITEDRTFILEQYAQGNYRIVNDQGNHVEIVMEGYLNYELVGVSGSVFVFYNSEEGQVKIFDPKAFMESPLSKGTSEQQDIMNQAKDLWEKEVLSRQEQWVQQAEEAYKPFLDLVPEDLRNDLNGEIRALFRKQDEAVTEKYDKAFDLLFQEGSPDWNRLFQRLPLDTFAERMEFIIKALKKDQEKIMKLVNGVSSLLDLNEIWVAFYEKLFSLASNQDVDIQANNIDIKFMEALLFGWNIEIDEHLEAMPLIYKLVKEMKDSTDVVTIRKMVRFLSRISQDKNGLDVMTRQLKQILNHENKDVRQNYLDQWASSFESVEYIDILREFKYPGADQDLNLGEAKKFIVFFTSDVPLVHTRRKIDPVAEEDIVMTKGGVPVEKIAAWNQDKKRSAEEESDLYTIEEMMAAIEQIMAQPDNEKSSQSIADLMKAQEAGRHAAEAAQNSSDAKAVNLVVEHYEDEETGDFVEEITDDGKGPPIGKILAMLIPKSNKEKGGQMGDVSGYFGKGKFALYAGIDRLEIIAKNDGEAYMFTIDVDPSGQQIRLVRVRKLARQGLKNGVMIRRIKKKGNGIAALDQMLSESSWKLFAGMAQREGFTISFVRYKDGKRTLVPLEVRGKKVLAETDFITKSLDTGATTNFGKFRIYMTNDPDVKSQIIDRDGIRVSDIKVKEEFLEFIPEFLRGYFDELGLIIQIPLPLMETRDTFRHEKDYLSKIQKYVAVEFYKALAHKALTDEIFRLKRFDSEWETGRNPSYWKGLTQKESPHLKINQERNTHLFDVVKNINKGQIDVIALSDLKKIGKAFDGKIGVRQQKEQWQESFILFMVQLDVDTENGKRDSLLKRRIKTQMSVNPKEALRVAAEHGIDENELDYISDPYFKERKEKAEKSVEAAKYDAEDYVISPEYFNEQQVSFFEWVKNTVGLIGFTNVKLLNEDFPVSGRFELKRGKVTIYFRTDSVSSFETVNPQSRDLHPLTNTLVHELAHFMQVLKRSSNRENLILNFSNDSTIGHQSRGEFGNFMKLLAAILLAKRFRNDVQGVSFKSKKRGHKGYSVESGLDRAMMIGVGNDSDFEDFSGEEIIRNMDRYIKEWSPEKLQKEKNVLNILIELDTSRDEINNQKEKVRIIHGNFKKVKKAMLLRKEFSFANSFQSRVKVLRKYNKIKLSSQQKKIFKIVKENMPDFDENLVFMIKPGSLLDDIFEFHDSDSIGEFIEIIGGKERQGISLISSIETPLDFLAAVIHEQWHSKDYLSLTGLLGNYLGEGFATYLQEKTLKEVFRKNPEAFEFLSPKYDRELSEEEIENKIISPLLHYGNELRVVKKIINKYGEDFMMALYETGDLTLLKDRMGKRYDFLENIVNQKIGDKNFFSTSLFEKERSRFMKRVLDDMGENEASVENFKRIFGIFQILIKKSIVVFNLKKFSNKEILVDIVNKFLLKVFSENLIEKYELKVMQGGINDEEVKGLLMEEIKQMVEEVLHDKSLLGQDNNLGGIDFNPGNFDLQTNGDKIDFDFPNILVPCFSDENPDCSESELENLNFNINGLTPVIIQMTPVHNLPLLLGVSEEDVAKELSRI